MQGTVFRAIRVEDGREVALKIQNPASGLLPGEQPRAGHESDILQRFDHPGIVRVLDVTRSTDGRSCLVLEWHPKGSLKQAELGLGGQLLPTLASLEVFARAFAQSLEVAHAAEIVHHDLEPSNVLLNEALQPVLTDFGLAREVPAVAHDGTVSMESSGVFRGNFRYAAPEQFDSNRRLHGPPMDLYAMGVILYQCLTGVLPVEVSEDAPKAYHDKIQASPLRPSQVLAAQGRRVPRADRGALKSWDLILMGLLQPSLDARYPTARAFLDDLHELARGQTPLRAHAERPSRSRGASVLLLVFALPLSVWWWLGSQQPTDEERSVRAMVAATLDRFDGMSAETQEALASEYLTLAYPLLSGDRLLARLHGRRASALETMGRGEEARADVEAMREILDGLVADLDMDGPQEDVELWRLHALSRVRLGDVAQHDRGVQDRFERYARALQFLEILADKHPQHSGVLDDLFWAYVRLADLHLDQVILDRPDDGSLEAAHRYLERAHLARFHVLMLSRRFPSESTRLTPIDTQLLHTEIKRLAKTKNWTQHAKKLTDLLEAARSRARADPLHPQAYAAWIGALLGNLARAWEAEDLPRAQALQEELEAALAQEERPANRPAWVEQAPLRAQAYRWMATYPDAPGQIGVAAEQALAAVVTPTGAGRELRMDLLLVAAACALATDDLAASEARALEAAGLAEAHGYERHALDARNLLDRIAQASD
jgi:serine/threonine protein kinase